MFPSLKKIDWVLFFITALIVFMGIFSFYQSGARATYLMQKQTIFALVGLTVMIGVSFVDYRIFRNYSSASIILYIISIILLIVALGFGKVRGASSWIFIGSVGFQPSEFAKLALVILLAKYFSQKHVEIYRTPHLIASAAYTALPATLTLLQPDFGSTVVFAVIWVAMLIFAGIKRKHLTAILMIGLISISFSWFVLFKQYQKDRIISFINPYLDPQGIGYNIIQAQTTFGSGGVWGTFISGNTKELSVLVPEQYTDFAFAAFGQKFGLAGVVMLFVLFLILLNRVGSIAFRLTNNFAKLFSLGLITIISVHVILNAGMNLGALPITGLPFTFLSYGGSHLITVLIGLGLVLSIKVRS